MEKINLPENQKEHASDAESESGDAFEDAVESLTEQNESRDKDLRDLQEHIAGMVMQESPSDESNEKGTSIPKQSGEESDSDNESADSESEKGAQGFTPEELESQDEKKDSEKEEDEETDEIKISEAALKERDAGLTEEQLEEFHKESQTLKGQGNECFKSGNYDDAVTKYTDALLTCPLCHVKDRSIMFSNRAAAFMKMEKNEDAIKDCTRAVDLNPNYLKALLRRAELHEKTEKLDEALADYQKALEMDPSLGVARAACVRLPEQINDRNEKMKAEMMGKLKDLGNLILRPFGLSTNNFNLQQDPNSGSYSVQFQQNSDNNNGPGQGQS